MAHWIFTNHVLEPNSQGMLECSICGKSWVKQPTSQCPGLMMYQWGEWPENLLTKKQLNDAGYSTAPKLLPAPAGACWREKSPDGLMFLYDRNAATLKRVLSDEEKAKRVEVAKRVAAKWKCPRCGCRKPRIAWDYCEDCGNHLSARDWARDILRQCETGETVILDSETTGLSAGYNEIVEVAVIDIVGRTLFDTRIKPLHPERLLERGDNGVCAYDINGIHPADLESAPGFAEVYDDLFRVLHGKTVLIYNKVYDTAMLRADRQNYSLPGFGAKEWDCAMEWYAQWVGQRRYERYGRDWSYRWQPLNGGHSALSDCQAVLGTLHEMAEEETVDG